MHLHLPHLPVGLVMLSVVYAAAVAVALTQPGQHTLAGLVVLAGLTARWTLRSRRRAPAPADVPDTARPGEPARAPAHAAAA